MSVAMSSRSSILASSPSQDRTISHALTADYVNQLWYFLASFIALVAVFQFASFLHGRFTRKGSRTGTDSEQGVPAASRQISLRRFPTALVNIYRVVAFRWTIGIGSYTVNLAEVLVTAMYMAALFAWAFVNTTDLSGHKLSFSYWSGRAGSLASSQFPLITALGTKNNIISAITGVSYDKLNYLHRMSARVVFVLIWVHGGSKLAEHFTAEVWEEPLIRQGFTALLAFTLLFVVSLRPVRAASYEVFFYSHFALVLAFLIMGFYHTRHVEHQNFIWPAFVVWGLDRLIRAIRVVVFNHSYFGFKSGSGTLDATTELLSEHFVRVTMRRPAHFHWLPGQTAYLIMPGVSTLPFEAHPFTIASYDSSANPRDIEKSSRTSSDSGEKGSDSDAAADYWKELVFLVNVQGGFTKRLAQAAAEGRKVKVFVDGPYGPSPDLGRFDTVVLVAGGSGVSYTVPVLLDLIERVRQGKSDCRRVVFIWAIRDATHIHWVSSTLSKALAGAPAGLAVDIRLFVTGASTPSWEDDSLHSVPSTESEKTRADLTKRPALLKSPGVTVAEGRPDLATLLGEEASLVERMAVCVCGSQAVAHAVRSALSFPVSGPASVLRGGASVTLHVESFGYA